MGPHRPRNPKTACEPRPGGAELIKLDTQKLQDGLVKIVGDLQGGLDSRKLTGDIAHFVAGRIKVRADILKKK